MPDINELPEELTPSTAHLVCVATSAGVAKYMTFQDLADYFASIAGGLTQLSAPTLTATVISSTQIDLSWTNVANESSFRLDWSADGSTGWTQIGGTIAANTLTYSHTGLTASTAYYYRVKAVGDGVNYSDSNYGTDDATTNAAGLLLDNYFTDISAAYSIARKLRTSYAGSAIRVRRSSDNTEQDIGFTANALDESALTTFVGANDGFIVTVYDQSSNTRDITQVDQSKQPRIVSSGTIDKVGTKPAAFTPGGGDDYWISAAFDNGADFSAWAVVKPNNTTGLKAILSADLAPNQSQQYLFQDGADFYSRTHYGSGTAVTARDVGGATTSLTLVGGISSTTSINIYTNGVADTPQAIASTPNSGSKAHSVGIYDGPAYPFEGHIAEVILYGADKSSDRTGIEGDINTFYTIF